MNNYSNLYKLIMLRKNSHMTKQSKKFKIKFMYPINKIVFLLKVLFRLSWALLFLQDLVSLPVPEVCWAGRAEPIFSGDPSEWTRKNNSFHNLVSPLRIRIRLRIIGSFPARIRIKGFARVHPYPPLMVRPGLCFGRPTRIRIRRSTRICPKGGWPADPQE